MENAKLIGFGFTACLMLDFQLGMSNETIVYVQHIVKD